MYLCIDKENGKMKRDEILEKIKQYLNDNKNSESLDVQADSENLLFWIENWSECYDKVKTDAQGS